MRLRALFWEAEDAELVATRLRAEGFDASVGREAFAGEDDDEDHPWAVTSDAPETLLELAAEEYDGWVDHPSDVRATPAPLDLPAAPRRHHRPAAAPSEPSTGELPGPL